MYFQSGRAADREKMKLLIGIAILLIAVVTFLKMRSRAPVLTDPGTPGTAAAARLKTDFHAVSIRPGVFACKAARELEGQRFLSDLAPRIPLAECDASDCTCRFAHHSDRRAGDDRRTPYPPALGLDPGSIGSDQRGERDRRSEAADSD
jgi:hypothetical protein